jgi:hypothetical protein
MKLAMRPNIRPGGVTRARESKTCRTGHGAAPDALLVLEAAGDDIGGDDDADHAAVAGHAAAVDGEQAPEGDFLGEGPEEGLFVEENVTQAAADEDPHHRGDDGIAGALGGDQRRAALAQPAEEEPRDQEPSGVGEAVPAQGPDGEGADVVQPGGQEHGGECIRGTGIRARAEVRCVAARP